jgi:hypothetical protein
VRGVDLQLQLLVEVIGLRQLLGEQLDVLLQECRLLMQPVGP